MLSFISSLFVASIVQNPSLLSTLDEIAATAGVSESQVEQMKIDWKQVATVIGAIINPNGSIRRKVGQEGIPTHFQRWTKSRRAPSIRAKIHFRVNPKDFWPGISRASRPGGLGSSSADCTHGRERSCFVDNFCIAGN